VLRGLRRHLPDVLQPLRRLPPGQQPAVPGLRKRLPGAAARAKVQYTVPSTAQALHAAIVLHPSAQPPSCIKRDRLPGVEARCRVRSPASGNLEPVGSAEWPPCETDGFTTAVCTELLGSGESTCEADFCAEGSCPLTHHCDHTCGFPCPDGTAQWPPDQPFLLCFATTCPAPPVQDPVKMPWFPPECCPPASFFCKLLRDGAALSASRCRSAAWSSSRAAWTAASWTRSAGSAAARCAGVQQLHAF
jgi:hypothetical protein